MSRLEAIETKHHKAKTAFGLALTVGVLFHLLIFLFIRFEVPAFEEQESGEAFVDFSSRSRAGDTVTRQNAIFLDSAPLFMPTQWNSANNFDGVASLEEVTEAFPPYEPRTTLDEANFQRFQLQEAIDPQPREFIPEDPSIDLAYLGRKPVDFPQAVAELPFLQFRSVRYPESKPFTLAVPATVALSAPENLWQPVQFLLHVDNGRVIGLPVLTESSGYPDWDSSLLSFLKSQGYQFPLKNDYYRAIIYP